ncbi:hypothetical protein BC941DRAFT_475629 [Chlamydoabsidia padenii]|nr:hypothetical protein BC941DRAFT_475629 [Chlamydoabsidia padenii]
MKQMVAMMNADAEAAFEDAHQEFEDFDNQPDDIWDASALIVYFDREYLGEKENWSLAYRQFKHQQHKIARLDRNDTPDTTNVQPKNILHAAELLTNAGRS